MNNTAGEGKLAGLPVSGNTAFSDHKGRVKNKLKKQQEKILQDFVPLLQQFLEPGEEIRLAARGASPFNALEQITTGWSMIYVIKRCILVFTDRRILHIPTNYKYRPRDIMAQILPGDVERLEVKGKSLKVLYKSGKKEKFTQIRNAKKAGTIIGALFTGQHAPSPVRQRHHLCPRCTSPLQEERYTCPQCRLEFKNPARAGFLSILLPGGGYFYTRRYGLGIIDAMVEAYLLILILALLFIGAGADNAEDGSAILIAAGLTGMILVLEKLATIYHAQHYIKEYIPAEKEFRRV